MKLLLFLLGSSISSIDGFNHTCPDAFCGIDQVSSWPTGDYSVECPGLAAETLATFEYLKNDGSIGVLIELRGPANMTDAADLVISAPHGGGLKPNYIDDRATMGQYCPNGCKTAADGYTIPISEVSSYRFLW